MKCVNPFVKWYRKPSSIDDPGEYVAFPCGKCIACRINKRKMWTKRLCDESLYSKSATFITLTYDDQHLPRDENDNPCPSVEDIQKFLKRLRKQFPKERIRFMINSEYGPQTLRPHYHGIIFNLPESIYDGSTEIFRDGSKSYISPLITKLWKCGDCEVAPSMQARCGYVAKYFVDRKEMPSFLSPNISLMSRRPGIGFSSIENIKEKVRYYGLRTLPNGTSSPVSIPRYYRQKIYSDEERTTQFENYVKDFRFTEQDLIRINNPVLVENIRKKIAKLNKPNSKIK